MNYSDVDTTTDFSKYGMYTLAFGKVLVSLHDFSYIYKENSGTLNFSGCGYAAELLGENYNQTDQIVADSEIKKQINHIINKSLYLAYSN
jgi:hypothetical protein